MMSGTPGTVATDALRDQSVHRTQSIVEPPRLRRLLPGLVIVAIVALIHSSRNIIKLVVTEPVHAWIADFGLALALDVLIGCAMLCAVVLAVRREPRRGRRQYVLVFSSVVLTALVAALANDALYSDGTFFLDDPDATLWTSALMIVPWWAEYCTLGLLVVAAWLYLCADAEHSAAIERIAVDSARLDQQTVETRLQMLEAQIEPHFLFNALAHVKRLYEIDPRSGARMLRNLKRYFEVALPQMREAESTLGREAAHAKAYVAIQEVRMGGRLCAAFDIPEPLCTARMPPLMLVTLVENAVKHGIGPLREGGRLDVRASADGGELRVVVADTGQGFVRSHGAGTGLANIRSRLAAQFGARARLSLASNSPHGVVATIALPLSQSATSPS